MDHLAGNDYDEDAPERAEGAWGRVLMPGCPRMANTYFDAGEQRAAKVNDLFARIAPR